MSEDQPATESNEPKTPKAKKAITIYVPETTYKKLEGYTEDGTEKQIGALATKCFSKGYGKIKTKKITKIDFED